MDSSFASDILRYEGRCGLPTNFDSTCCYALGYAASALLQSGRTGLISSVGNLAAHVSKCTVGGIAFTSLMDVERRHACDVESEAILCSASSARRAVSTSMAAHRLPASALTASLSLAISALAASILALASLSAPRAVFLLVIDEECC
ncbi:hypothetical protein MLD38_036819 [Melastoma candidum]|uniref:Uncharacterized protein n=1 Tax=Melastoma candidum TaxID=119954 RepID=A0ACB9LLK4_9MYRT|nr:hypothetical protein MLD38_036819 [Melastoma candidum]